MALPLNSGVNISAMIAAAKGVHPASLKSQNNLLFKEKEKQQSEYKSKCRKVFVYPY